MPDDIEIRLKTTGDTAGADEVKKSLFAVRDESKKASDQADVELVKKKQSAAADEQQAASIQKVVKSQQQLLALQLAQALQGISGKLQGISPELDLIVEGTQNFLTTFVATGDPIKATLALTASAISGVVTAYMEAEKQVKKIAETEAESIKHISELRSAYAIQVRNENLTSFFAAELRELDKQEAALKRIYQIRASERELDAARQATAGAAAVAGGASPEGVAAQALAAGLQSSLAELKDNLDAATAKTEKLESDALLLKGKADGLVENTDDQKAALDAAEAAKQTAEDSRADLTAFTTTTANQMQTLVETGKATGLEISTAGLAAITEAAENEKTALKAEVEKLAENSSASARTALATLTKVLADGVIKPEELAELRTAMNSIRVSRESSDKLVKEGFEALKKADEAFVQSITPVVSRIGETLTLVNSLAETGVAQSNQIRELQFQINQINSRSDGGVRNY